MLNGLEKDAAVNAHSSVPVVHFWLIGVGLTDRPEQCASFSQMSLHGNTDAVRNKNAKKDMYALRNDSSSQSHDCYQGSEPKFLLVTHSCNTDTCKQQRLEFNGCYSHFSRIIEEQNRRQGLSAEELDELPPLPEFKPMYNAVMSTIIDGVQVELNRASWISVDDQPLRYKLDTMSLPM